MPGTGAQPRRAKEVPFQEQADEPGREHHRPVGEHVRLGEIPADEGRDQAAPAAGPRWLPAVVRGGDRRQDQRDQGGAHAAVRAGHDPGDRPRLQRLRVVSGTDAGGSVLRDADEGEGGLRGARRIASAAKQQRGERPDHLLSPTDAGGRGAGAVPAGGDLGRGETGDPSCSSPICWPSARRRLRPSTRTAGRWNCFSRTRHGALLWMS